MLVLGIEGGTFQKKVRSTEKVDNSNFLGSIFFTNIFLHNIMLLTVFIVELLLNYVWPIEK
jgi:hypothetical protein